MGRPFLREYDLRGRAVQLDDADVCRLGHQLAASLQRADDREPRVVVGRDARLSSPRLRAALIEGLLAGGVEVLDVGLGPSPLVYFSVHHFDADGGVMVTGSHNPPEDNGFKLMRGHRPLYGADLRALVARLDQSPPPATRRGRVVPTAAEAAYVHHVGSSIHLGPRRLRVVIDAGSGAAGDLGVRALRSCGIDPVCLHCRPDGRFPHRDPDPQPDQLEALRAAVLAEGADVGLAWDGDGDRLAVLDGNGDYIDNDRVLVLFAQQVLADHPGSTILGEVRCSQALFDEVARLGGRPMMCRAGHSYLKARLKDAGARLGGELSGHFFFADRYLGFDDAIYASLRLLEILSARPGSIAERLRAVPFGHASPEVRMPCAPGSQATVIEAVRASLDGTGEVSDVDGVRVRYPDGSWAVVRASHTGPHLVTRYEAPSEQRLRELRTSIETVIAVALDLVPRTANGTAG